MTERSVTGAETSSHSDSTAAAALTATGVTPESDLAVSPQKTKRAWWETTDTRRIYSKYALRRLFGYDGYQRIKNRNWTTTSLSLLALGIVSDISEIFGPITKIGLYASIIAASILGIIILRRLRFCDLCVVPFVLSVIFAAIFGGVAIAQSADPTPGDGVAADWIPGVTEFQKVILGALFEIKKTTDDTNARVAELQSQIEEMSQQHNQRYEEILSKLETEKGISKSALSEHLVKLGATPEIPVQDIPAFLERFADDYQALQQRLMVLDVDDTQLAEIRREASQRLEAGDLSGARTVLRDARKIITQGRQTSAGREAALLADEAAIDNLDLDYGNAAAKYIEAAELAAFDPEIANNYKFSAANVLYTLGADFGDSVALRQAVILFKDGLGYYTLNRGPLDWALTQNNLGNALAKLGEREGNRTLLNEAVTAYRNALEAYSREDTPLDWAMAQNNLGSVLLELSEQEYGTERLQESVDAFLKALLERTRKAAPYEWAATKNNLGNAYRILALRSNDPILMQDAVNAYRDALNEWTIETAPTYWATAQSNLGNALVDLGELEPGTERFEEAVEVFDIALGAVDRNRFPLLWATMQNNRGWALTSLGQRAESGALLQDAVEAFAAALQERTRDRVPMEWAYTQKSLGKALGLLGWVVGDTSLLEDAIMAFELALEELTLARVPFDWVNTRIDLADTHQLMGDLTGQDGTFIAAANQFQTLINTDLEMLGPMDAWMSGAQFQHRKCWSLIRAMESAKSLQYQLEAESACTSAFNAMSTETQDAHRLDTIYNLAYFHLTVAEIGPDEVAARRALERFQTLQDDPGRLTAVPPRPDVLTEITRAQALLGQLQESD